MTRRKSKARTEDEDRLVRGYYLIRAITQDDPSEIDGVIFHLKTGLDPEEWTGLCVLGLYGRGAFDAPGIIFPWTPDYWADFYRKRGQVIEAPAGSHLSIAVMRDAPAPALLEEFEEPASRERKLAYVCVFTPDGQAEIAQYPLVFVRRDAVASLLAAGDYSGAYRAMLARLGATIGVEDVEALVDGPFDTWPEFPEFAPKPYALAMLALQEREKDFDGHAMAAFGYLIARAEAETLLLAPARRGRETIAQARRASLAKAEMAKAALQPMLKRAEALCDADQNLTLTRCANLLAAEFPGDPRWIRKKIIHLFEKRSNGREYRPRRVVEE